ncbi:hypothetical protein ACFQPF_02595 [Fictibacillus iocasae]|uniref:IrrE N-terminal-like domain-containing protein n=1 Tax=Fictibacillus iocasae TaxID=2715437 RepID=A0ABW2NPF3_9BACL
MTEINEVKQWIEPLIHLSNTSADVFIQEENQNGRRIGGMYSMDTHTVTLYQKEIYSQAMEFFPEQDRFRDYVRIICAHELGHANDPYLTILAYRLDKERDFLKRKKIELLIEVQAWKYAKIILTGLVPSAVFRKVRKESLFHYYETIDQLLKNQAA